MKNIRFDRKSRAIAAARNAGFRAGYAAGVKDVSDNFAAQWRKNILNGMQDVFRQQEDVATTDCISYSRMREFVKNTPPAVEKTPEEKIAAARNFLKRFAKSRPPVL